MSPGKTDRVMEARRQDSIDELRRRFLYNPRLATVRNAGHGCYSRARRAFGSWQAAIEAANLEGDVGGDLDLAAIDVISPHPLPGLPRHLRERQILGGKLLEHLARAAQGDPRVLDDQETLGFRLLDAFYCELHRWNGEHNSILTPIVASALNSGRAELSQVYADGM